MKMTLDMAVVTGCEAEDCACNVDLRCHARAITIGDGERPACDTLVRGEPVPSLAETLTGVGACKMTGCLFNEDLECRAERIVLGDAGGGVHCLMHSARP